MQPWQHSRDCAYVTSDGPAPCTCTAGNHNEPPVTRDEFLSRFKKRLRDLLGEHYDFKYVEEIAPTYWADIRQRSYGPEECAESEASEWDEE